MTPSLQHGAAPAQAELFVAGTDRFHVAHGDCLDIARQLPDACLDSLVTDPPAGIGFMGKEWDDFRRSRNPNDAGRENAFGRLSRHAPEAGRRSRDVFVDMLTERLAEAYRLLKPGACALIWALPRTSHWTGLAIEEAGFEIRDSVHHFFGSGFPKSKALLKPGHEVWWLARKPGPLAELRIDDCRIPYVDEADESQARVPQPVSSAIMSLADGSGRNGEYYDPSKGRWPPNVVFTHSDSCGETCADDCPVGELDRQTGTLVSGARSSSVVRHSEKTRGILGKFGGDGTQAYPEDVPASEGGGSRFFPQFRRSELDSLFIYAAKPSRAERNAGLPSSEEPAVEQHATMGDRERADWTARNGNHHPTVKSVSLMSWLCRLITPKGGLVGDFFTGSGTTGMAAMLEGLRFLGVEQDAAYRDIALARITHAAGMKPGPVERVKFRKRDEKPGQADLFVPRTPEKGRAA